MIMQRGIKKNMRGTILQPTYLPWMGYFEMIDSTEIYVVFDHVQFKRKSWQQRNKIKTSNGVIRLIVPAQKTPRDTRISDVKISYNQEDPLEKHWKTIILAYKKAPYFDKYKSFFETIYHKEYTLLRDLNVEIIKGICNILDIKTKIIFSSELDLNDQDMGKTEKIINLCKKVGISHLYDTKGAQDFIDSSLFQKERISLSFQNFHHPKYSQLWGEFVPYLSIIDLLFNHGLDKSLGIIRSGRKKSMDYLSFRQNSLGAGR